MKESESSAEMNSAKAAPTAKAEGCKPNQQSKDYGMTIHQSDMQTKVIGRAANQLPVIAGVEITTDDAGRFNLNALHRASGLGASKAPAQWLRTKQAQDLITEAEKQTVQICIVSTEGRNGGTFAHELLAISYAGWISPVFQLQVNQVFLNHQTKKTDRQSVKKASKSYLPEYRQARAIKMTADAITVALSVMPNLSQEAKQVAMATAVNTVVGDNILPLPVITEHYYTAGEVGERYGISANKVGRLANEHNLKNEKYGKFFLDQSRSSTKQVETFRYNDAGMKAIGEIITLIEVGGAA